MKKILTILFLCLAVFATSWSLLHPEFFRTHDFVHGARIAEMLRDLQSGEIPPRWTSNFGFGYGMPLFEFYAPLPYFVGAIFYWLGVPLVDSIKLLYVLCAVVTFLGMYKLGAKLFGRAGGWLSAFALTMAPYRAVNLYVRGAISEAWGTMALPWVLYGTVRVVKGEKGGWLTLVVGLLMLFLSHNITTLLFLPVAGVFAAGYWLLNWQKIRSIQGQKSIPAKRQPFVVLGILAGTYLLSIGLAAFYLFPAYLEKDYTIVNGIFQGYFDYHLHFLYIRQFFYPNWGYGGSTYGPNDTISFFLGYGQLFGLVAAVVFLVWSMWRKWWHKQPLTKIFADSRVLFFLLVFVLLLFSMFMAIGKSQFIWDKLPFMAVVQFPWRWLSVTVVLLALLVGAGAWFIHFRPLRYVYMLAGIVLMIATNTAYFRPESYLASANSLYYSDAYRIRHDMSKTLTDYIPIQMKRDPLSQELPPIDVPYTIKDSDPKEATLVVDHVQEKLLSTQFTHPTTVEFSTADFPGWTVFLDGKEVPKHDAPLGNIEVSVPAGGHLVGIQFLDTPVRWWSDAASAVSILILLFLLVPKEKWLPKQGEVRNREKGFS